MCSKNRESPHHIEVRLYSTPDIRCAILKEPVQAYYRFDDCYDTQNQAQITPTSKILNYAVASRKSSRLIMPSVEIEMATTTKEICVKLKTGLRKITKEVDGTTNTLW